MGRVNEGSVGGVSVGGRTAPRSVAPTAGAPSNRRRAGASLGVALLAAVLPGGGCASRGYENAASIDPAATEQVRQVLEIQVAAWNRKDLDAFMAGYWPSEHMVFMTREGSTRGFAETLARYRRSYADPSRFGRLAFSDLSFETVDLETVLARGAWRLHETKDEPHGRFVLVVRRFREGWRIVSDYTTSEPLPAGPAPSVGG